MRFSRLLAQLACVAPDGPRSLADDPELHGAEALDRAGSGELSFLEPGNALAASLAACGAGALLIPARGEEAEALQRQASEQGIAWAALADPRLGFAEALEILYPRPRPAPGLHPSAVVDPSARLGAGAAVFSNFA